MDLRYWLTRCVWGAVALAGALQPAAAADAPGSLLWQDRFAGGYDTTARVAVDDGRVFVAGKGPVSPGADTGWLVKAYDQSSGKVLWDDAFAASNAELNKSESITTGGGLVFAGGFVAP